MICFHCSTNKRTIKAMSYKLKLVNGAYDLEPVEADSDSVVHKLWDVGTKIVFAKGVSDITRIAVSVG